MPRRIPCPDSSLPQKAWFGAFRRGLQAWYASHARDLPWRRRRDPYAVWVSEIMLQQTQVATVAPYFTRFLRAFPTLPALAAADERQVLRLWEGLGYYRRARQMHQAAQQIVAEHGGRFPAARDAVLRLPGIGRYTAGAILSIAFDAREPILEANTTRLFARLLGYRGDPLAKPGQELLWSLAAAVLPARGAGQFNQALMELGSLVCTPREPRCGECPAAALCAAQCAGLQAEIPPPKAKRNFESRCEAAVVVRRVGRVLVAPCGAAGRWAGLWDFPRFTLQTPSKTLPARQLAAALLDALGVRVRMGAKLLTIKHGVTRFRITLDCFTARYRSGAPPADARWVAPEELAEYPLSTTGRKIAEQLK